MKVLTIIIIISIGVFCLIQSGIISFNTQNLEIVMETIKNKSEEIKTFLGPKIVSQGTQTRSVVIEQHEQTRDLIHANRLAIIENKYAAKESEFSIKTTIQNYSLILLLGGAFAFFVLSLLIMLTSYMFISRFGGK